MKSKFEWVDKEKMSGEICVENSDPEELKRFFTQFKYYMNRRDFMGSLDVIDEGTDYAKYSLQTYYVDNEYHLEKYGPQEQYLKNLEKQVNILLQDDYTRDTNTTLMDAIVEELKKEGLYKRFQAIKDYYLPENYNVVPLTNYEFDIIAFVNYGSEGTWLNCSLYGSFDNTDRERISLGTFKTLDESQEASLIMGELGGAIAYIGGKYVNRNLERFSPDRTD